MNNAPSVALPAVSAQASAAYTMPHGSQPHSNPSPSALSGWFTGRNFRPKGSIRTHSLPPIFSNAASAGHQPAR